MCAYHNTSFDLKKEVVSPNTNFPSQIFVLLFKFLGEVPSSPNDSSPSCKAQCSVLHRQKIKSREQLEEIEEV